jgi:hypothetical protein
MTAVQHHPHDHGHPHDHAHPDARPQASAAGHHHTSAPSGQGTVVLDIGGDIGALVIYTPASCNGDEYDVSPVGDPQRRTHAEVRARYTGAGVVWSEVVSGLRAGRYTVWRDAVTPVGEVDITGGAVAEFEWPTAGDDRSVTSG